MFIARTPLRIPFAGGLTDLKKYAEDFGGVTVSATINKNVYAAIKTNVDGYLNLKYKDVQEKVIHVKDVKNDLIRETLKVTRLDQTPVDIYIMVDLNSESGLGTSGALTVSLLNAMHAYKGEEVSVYQLIDEAAYVEVDALGGASGFHDPAICALGDIRFIEYDGKTVKDRKIEISPVHRDLLDRRLMFFYNGRHYQTKPSLDILNSQMDQAQGTLAEIKENAYQIDTALAQGNFQQIAESIQKQQTLKQQLPGKFTDDYVESIVEKINSLGAHVQLPGGKIGSFLMVYCPEEKQNILRKELADMTELDFSFTNSGTQVTEI